MTSRNRRLTQKADIKRRVKAPPQEGFQRCAIFQCTRPTQRSAAKGLSDLLCKKHSEHLRTHGHATRKSYSKAELAPYRDAAREWYRWHRKDVHVAYAIAKLESLMAAQGRSKDAYWQRSMAPKDKARNVLARLHEADKSGLQLLRIVLAVKAAHTELGPWGAPGWVHVQIAKQVKRLRGVAGTRTGLARLPMKFPRGEGLYMRHLGEMIEERAAHAIDREAVDEVLFIRKKQ